MVCLAWEAISPGLEIFFNMMSCYLILSMKRLWLLKFSRFSLIVTFSIGKEIMRGEKRGLRLRLEGENISNGDNGI